MTAMRYDGKLYCTYCSATLLDTQAVTGPDQQPFCSSKCRDIWIWRSLEQPSEEAFNKLLNKARAAQAEYFLRLKRSIEAHRKNYFWKGYKRE